MGNLTKTIGGTTMTNKITVGVIGIGRIGKLHIDNILAMKQVEIKCVVDPYIDQAADWLEERHIKSYSTDHSLLFSDKEINAVLICSPTDTHITYINLAIENNMHIFCEKPISFFDDETLTAYNAIKNSNLKVQIGFNRRFDHNYDQVKELVLQKQIGDLHLLRITSRDPEPPNHDYVKHSGGLFMDMSIHDFDMARFISGCEVTEVYATGAALIDPSIKEFGDVDTAIIQLKFENGALGVIDNSRQAKYGYDQRIEAFGSNGSAESDNDTKTQVHLTNEAGVISNPPLHFFLERYKNAYQAELKGFFNSIEQNSEPSCTFLDGIMAQRIAQAAKESLETGLPVKVKTV